MRRFTLVRRCVSVLLVVGLSLAAREPALAVDVEVRGLSEKPLANVPVTFGQVFKKGEIADGIVARLGGKPAALQADVKRLHDDRSVRFAVISARLPQVLPHGKVTLSLVNGVLRPATRAAVSQADLLKTDFDAVVTLTFPDGAVRQASARKMLEKAGENAERWLHGPVATEWLLSGPPTDAQGKADEDLSVQFQVRAFAGCRRARVSVVVENCWDTWAGNIRYDASVTVGGKAVFSAKAVDHRRLSRWRKVVWWGDGRPPVHVIHDLPHLSSTGALPRYDTSLPEVEQTWEQKKYIRMEGPDFGIMGKGALTAYMPSTGGRPEIAPYPKWTVLYLLSMRPREKALALAGGDLAGSWPVHVRARKTGRIMTIDERPQFWLNGRGKDKPTWKGDRHPPGPNYVKLTADMAHQPSLAYVPYLVTGDFYYLEEAWFWANYCLLNTWPHPRRGADGILSGQIRGNAWSLRNLADACWVTPAGRPEAPYFDRKIRNNLADRIRRMLGPPEYNRMGFWGIRSTQNARIQNPANPDWMVIAPWEHDYLMWSLHHLVELGWTEAGRARDFLLRWRVGALTHAPDFDPLLATPYRFVVGDRAAGGEVTFYEDWKRLGRENARLSKPGLPNYGCSYAYSARAACVCGMDAGFPKSGEAAGVLEANLPDFKNVMAKNPIWAILPGGAAAK